MGKKLTVEEIINLSKDPTQCFDQCEICHGIEEAGTMLPLNDVIDFGLVCVECKIKMLNGGESQPPASPASSKTRKFKFYLDQKVTTWKRTPFSVDAVNQQQANMLAEQFHKQGNTLDLDWEDIDDVPDEVMELDDNDGFSTEELYSTDGEIIYQNGKD